MENKEQVLHVLAEDVSINEQASNDIFLLVEFLMFTSEANLNGEGVTVAFISDFLENTEDYISLPLYCDTENLLAGRFTRLGHRYSRETGSFDTVQIGGFVKFWSKEEDGVMTVYGQARIPKREHDICERIIQLYKLGKLSMSFEVRYLSSDTVQKDGATFIDVGENNKLTGACICWQPAFPDAHAQLLVAEEQGTDESELIVAGDVSEEDGADTEVSKVMPNEKENLTAEVTEETVVAEEQAQVEAVAETEEVHETVAEEQTVVAEEQEEQKDPEEEKETVAEVQEASAEVIEHSVDTHESVEECPYSGKPVHVIEYHERIIETMEDAGNLIAELDAKVAELEEIKGKYDAMIAEAQAKALAEKKEQAKAFAEKQGLDVNDTAVAEAIDHLDYTKIAELTMAQAQEEKPAEEEQKPAVTLASFVELDISDDKYGGLLSRKSK